MQKFVKTRENSPGTEKIVGYNKKSVISKFVIPRVPVPMLIRKKKSGPLNLFIISCTGSLLYQRYRQTGTLYQYIER